MTARRFCRFWADAQAETDCAAGASLSKTDGALSYQVLSVEEGTFYARFLRLEQTGDGSVTASGFERHPVQEWNLTQNREFLLPPLSRRRQALRRLPAYPDKCAGRSTFRCTRTLRASD